MRKCWKPAFSPIPTIFSNLKNPKKVLTNIFASSCVIGFSLDKNRFFFSIDKYLSDAQTTYSALDMTYVSRETPVLIDP